MSQIITALVSIFLLSSLSAVSKEGELKKTLTDLISTTERQLALQKELKTLVDEFQSQQDLFHKGPQTKQLAGQMVTTAATILKMAEENHYLHLFPAFDIEELRLFAGIAKKTTPVLHDSSALPRP